jgi:hypothetical protein
LPIDVPPGSLLPVFGSAGEDGVSANDAVFVVSKNLQLERRRAPADVDTYPWCKLEAEIVEELPSWEEAVAMVKAELGPVDRNELLAFRDSEWARKPSAAEAIKLGGWAAGRLAGMDSGASKRRAAVGPLRPQCGRRHFFRLWRLTLCICP